MVSISCLKLEGDRSFCVRIFINLWLGGFCFIVFRRMKYGWWSENLCVSIPARASIVMVVTLQKKLSIRVPLVSVNLVGRVILGRKLFVVRMS